MLHKTGLMVSAGIAIGKAVILDLEAYEIPKRTLSPAFCESEVQRATHAFEEAAAELGRLESDSEELASSEIHDLFSVHRHFLQDKSLRERVLLHSLKSPNITGMSSADRTQQQVR